jgi:hypothetical protein
MRIYRYSTSYDPKYQLVSFAAIWITILLSHALL